MIDIFNKFNDTVLYKDGNTLQNKIKELKLKLDNCSIKEKEKIKNDIKKYEYGLRGEANIIYELMNSHIPMYILHDINIEYRGYKAQIDFLVFTRKNCFIIECKHLYGDVFIDNKGDFYRSNNGRLSAIYSPITQLERHINVIRKYINDRNGFIGRLVVSKTFDEYYHGIVVFSNENTRISDKNAPYSIKNRVIRADKIINYIKKMENESKELSSSEKEIKGYADKILSFCVEDKNVSIDLDIEEDSKDIEIHVKEDKNSQISDEVLRDRLKKYRLKKAKELNYKPYFIFNDSTLNDLVMKRPKNIEELKRIEGIADKKNIMYGSDILRIVNGEYL